MKQTVAKLPDVPRSVAVVKDPVPVGTVAGVKGTRVFQSIGVVKVFPLLVAIQGPHARKLHAAVAAVTEALAVPVPAMKTALVQHGTKSTQLSSGAMWREFSQHQSGVTFVSEIATQTQLASGKMVVQRRVVPQKRSAEIFVLHASDGSGGRRFGPPFRGFRGGRRRRFLCFGGGLGMVARTAAMVVPWLCGMGVGPRSFLTLGCGAPIVFRTGKFGQ
jgi:hypothetical protein